MSRTFVRFLLIGNTFVLFKSYNSSLIWVELKGWLANTNVELKKSGPKGQKKHFKGLLKIFLYSSLLLYKF